VLQLNLRAVSQPPEGAAVKLLPIRWLARGVAVAYCAGGAYTVFDESKQITANS